MTRVAAAAIAALLLLPAAAPAAERFEARISRTEFGIPHIRAKDYAGIGYGYARALAADTFCTVAEAYVTSNGERSRFFGPDARYSIRGNGSSARNLNSDLFYQRIRDRGIVERLLAEEPPRGPKPELKQAVRGYVAGWNSWLREVGGAEGVPDHTCRGAAWARPIDEMDVYRRFYSLSLLASSGVAIDGIAEAQPPARDSTSSSSSSAATAARALPPGILDERLGGLGSNAYGLGRAATASGHGMVFGNPHFPWQGAERFYQAHLTIPGRLDVMGGSLLGVPVVNIGFTRGLAWSHTVSTARRFVPYELQLVPGSPTTYLYDGQPRQMRADRVTVAVKRGDGLERVTRTLYSSHHGPILNGILGLPIFPWTSERAYAMHDANAENFGRLLNHFFDFNHARSVEQAETILKRYLGIPWVNTIAADTAGNAYYADIGSVPHVTEDKRAACSTEVGRALDEAQRLIVLDGARAACEPGSDPDAIAPGILGPGRLPSLRRDDHVSNMNDSYWLTHPSQRLEGFPRIIGDERTQRSLRTRLGIRLILDRLAGRDGLAGNRFDLDNLREVAWNNRVFAGELWRDDLVRFCESNPTVGTTAGPVDVRPACPVLRGWNLRDDLDPRGAVLFRRFVTRLTGATPVTPPGPAGFFSRPFDVNDPVGTPSGLNTSNPVVAEALGQAVNDVRNAGLKLDASLREGQTVTRRGERIPIHGGPGGAGVFNVITPVWDPRRGYTEVVHGSSYVQAVELRPECPRGHTILTYGLSTDPDSRRTSDQTEVYSRKGWVTPPFCSRDLERDPHLERTHTVERPDGTVLRAASLEEARGRRAPRVAVTLTRAANVRVRIARGGRVQRVVRRRVAAGRRVLAPRVRKGRYRVTVIVGRGPRAETARFSAQQR